MNSLRVQTKSFRQLRAAAILILSALLAVALVQRTDTAVPASAAEPGHPPYVDRSTRLGGADRFATAVQVSQQFAPGRPAVFVVPGLDFPDAVAAGAAAGKLGAPILLTARAQLTQATFDEVRRLAPGRIYVVGGTGVIDGAVEKRLRGVAPTTRIGGKDRYETGRKLLQQFFPSADQVLVATGRDFPDALSATAVAGARALPLLLVDGGKSALDAATQREIQRLRATRFTLVGGTGVVSNGIQNQLAQRFGATARVGGQDRFDTSARLNAAFPPSNTDGEYFLASGTGYPDALSGAALAGVRKSALFLTQPDCLPIPVSDGVVSPGLRKNVVLGGEGVVFQGAARGARCVPPVKTGKLGKWATTGWAVRADVPAPYSDRPPVDVRNSPWKFDSTGLLIYKRLDNGQRAEHPVAYAQYGISALLEYQRTGDRAWLTRAIRHADQLRTIRVERDGAWWFPYRFPWTYLQRTLNTPWWSGMAQGEALSLFSRLSNVTADPKWRDAADRTWKSLNQPYASGKPFASLVIDDHLYLEEYAGNQPPLLVLNGQIFGAFGVYDYWLITGDPAAKAFFDGTATTVLDRMVSYVRVEQGVSYYCVQSAYCASPKWQNAGYHPIHSWQLDTLARLTDDTRFSSWGDLLRSDYAALRAVDDGSEDGMPLFIPGQGTDDLGGVPDIRPEAD